MWFLLFASAVLAQNACYYAANKRAGSAIVPCSSGSGVAACCQIGDLCLADSACWNPQYNVTYLYGCTDSTYQDANCPFKCGSAFEGAPYVGLDYCANTTRNEWSCTHPPNDNPAIQAFSAQQCYNDSIIAFAGPKSLQPILSLPTAAGGATLYFSQVNPTSYLPVSGYTPSTTPSATASKPSSVELVSTVSTSGTRTSTAGNTITSGPTSTPTEASAAESSGLSTGAKAGIGAGIGGAAIAIAALVIAWLILRRRKPAAVGKDAEDRSSASTFAPEKQTLQSGPSELPPNERKPSIGPSELPLNERKPSIGPSELPESESNFGTPAPTYTSWSRPQPGQQVYELPAQNVR